MLLQEGLDLPDGVAFSPSARWIAVSNHNTGSVLVFRNKGSLDRWTKPAGHLRGAGYPHGVRFTADSQFVFVSDAGSTVVHVYLGIGDDWHGTRDPVTTLRGLSQKAYLRGRTNRQEGGPRAVISTAAWGARGDVASSCRSPSSICGRAQNDRASFHLTRLRHEGAGFVEGRSRSLALRGGCPG